MTIPDALGTAFAAALVSEPPDAAACERLRLFGQFVGTWDLEVTEHAADGAQRTMPGEWHFGWLLGGRAVGDVWIFPARSTGLPPVEHGMSVRFPDPAVGGWRSTWIGPGRKVVRPFVAREAGDEIVLSGAFDDGEARWVFSDIAAATFHWRNEQRTAPGDPWRLLQTFRARRGRRPPGA